jgi:hypothetical protein
MPVLNKGCEKYPKKPNIPYPPAGGTQYRVKTNDDWGSVARAHGISAKELIHFNFGTTDPPEVNWFLRTMVGCVKSTHDRNNWMFSSEASPGLIYLPPKHGWKRPVFPPDPQKDPTPKSKPKEKSGIWFGIGGQTGGHLFVAGKDTVEACLFSFDSYQKRFWLNVDGYRVGPGLGGSIGLVLVIATGAPEPSMLQGLKVTGWDFQAALAGRWGDLAKAAKELKVVRQMASGAKFVDKTISVLEWEKLRDIINNLRRVLMMEKKDVLVLSIPGAGIGLELSGYYGWGSVHIHDQTGT